MYELTLIVDASVIAELVMDKIVAYALVACRPVARHVCLSVLQNNNWWLVVIDEFGFSQCLLSFNIRPDEASVVTDTGTASPGFVGLVDLLDVRGEMDHGMDD